MKIRVRSSIVLFLLIGVLFFFVVQASNNELPATELLGSSECNRCHGPSHKGHVSFSTSFNTPESLLNGTEMTVSVLIKNNDYPLSSSSVTIQETSEYSLVAGESPTFSLGTLSRGQSKTAEWTISLHVPSAKLITLKASFQGTARDHKVFTYTKAITKSVFVSTTPTPILQVLAYPQTGSTFYTGETITGNLTVSNIGTLDMDNIKITASGSVLVDGKSSVVIDKLKPKETVTFTLKFDTSRPIDNQITIGISGQYQQQAVVSVSIRDPPPIPLPVLLGRGLGYLAYTALLISAITGVAKYPLRRWFSGRKLRILHADLSNISFTLVIIHAFTLLIPNSPWGNVYQWFQLLPGSIPSSSMEFGLELGRWGLLLMYISLLTGYYFSKLVKKFGRQLGIRIHMLSYVALIGGAIHAIVIGGTASIPVVSFIITLSLFLVIWAKYDSLKRQRKKREQRMAKRAPSKRVPVKAQVPSKDKEKVAVTPSKVEKKHLAESVVDMRTGSSRGVGIVCWNCMTLNDDDANFCKRCGNRLLGKICTSCKMRNEDDANFCKGCGGNSFQTAKKEEKI